MIDYTSTFITGFGELTVTESFPFIQAVPSNNFLPANFRSYTSAGGSATVSDFEFTCTTGTTVYGYGAIQSFRSLNYKAGQSGLARFTARFPTGGVANAWQGVGLINLGDELSFGYNGTDFGIWYRHHGLAEVQKLTLTVGASGSETATVTINGSEKSIPITSGTTAKNAYEIATWINANVSGWEAYQYSNTVELIATSDGAKGEFDFASDGAATGAFTQLTAGVTKTSEFIKKEQWNVEKMPGLDPTKGNVYQIIYQYLGYGNIRFYVENPNTGEMVLVHMLQYPNENSRPSLGNPSLRVGMYVASVGSQTDITAKSASMAGFLQGRYEPVRNPRAYDRVYTSLTTTFSNIFTLQNMRIVNGYVNNQEIALKQLSVFTESNKGATFEIFSNATIGGTTNYSKLGSNLMSSVDTSGTTVTGGILLASYVIPGNSSQIIDLTPLGIQVPPSLRITVAAKTNSGNAADAGASLIWYEGV